MARYLDADRFRARLEEMQESLTQSARERHEADGADDPTALRMDGGVANLHLLLTQLHHFEVDPSKPKQTPIKDIRVPDKLKVRRRAPGTSWEAAHAQTSERSQPLYKAIYLVLSRKGPMNDDELRRVLAPVLEKYSYAPEGVTMRRGELVKAGWVRATDLRRSGDSGALMTVWEAVPEDG